MGASSTSAVAVRWHGCAQSGGGALLLRRFDAIHEALPVLSLTDQRARLKGALRHAGETTAGLRDRRLEDIGFVGDGGGWFAEWLPEGSTGDDVGEYLMPGSSWIADKYLHEWLVAAPPLPELCSAASARSAYAFTGSHTSSCTSAAAL
jgi:hypothetical protein